MFFGTMSKNSDLQNLKFEAKSLLELSLSSLSGIDWANELQVILTAIVLGSIIVSLLRYLFTTHAYQHLADQVSNYISATPAAKYFRILQSTPRLRPGPIYARPKNPNDPTRRTVFTDTSVAIYGWPSRGGAIVLADATHVDLIFLGLNTTDPPLKRNCGPDLDPAVLEEDAFCRDLLLLGAKWWDSEARYRFVSRFAAGFQPAIDDVDDGRVEEPVLRERRWVKVGWERTTAADVRAGGTESGGLWVLDCDTNMEGILEEDNMPPLDAGRLILATSMAERCEILGRLGGRHFARLEEYDGDSTYLRAWEWKSEGEVGELVRV